MVGARVGDLEGGAVGCIKGGVNIIENVLATINCESNYYSFGIIDDGLDQQKTNKYCVQNGVLPVL